MDSASLTKVPAIFTAFSSPMTTAICTSQLPSGERATESTFEGGARPATPPSQTTSPSQNRGRSSEAAAPNAAASSSVSITQPVPVKPSHGGGSSQKQQIFARTAGPKTAATRTAARTTTNSLAKDTAKTASNSSTQAATRAMPPETVQPKGFAESGTFTTEQQETEAKAARGTREPQAEDLDPGNYLTMNCYGPYSVGVRDTLGHHVPRVAPWLVWWRLKPRAALCNESGWAARRGAKTQLSVAFSDSLAD